MILQLITIAFACTCFTNYNRVGSRSMRCAIRVKRPLITITTLLNHIIVDDGFFIAVLPRAVSPAPAISTTAAISAASPVATATAISACSFTASSIVVSPAVLIAAALLIALRYFPGPVPDL